MAHYGKFSGVTDYIAMIGPKGKDLEEKVGYYGERLVLYAQQLGLNTCWVAMTYSKVKSAYTVNPGENFVSSLQSVTEIRTGLRIAPRRKRKFLHGNKKKEPTQTDVPVLFQVGIE